MNMIILAALALIILVVLSVILVGRVKIFSSGVDSCKQKGGECVTDFGVCQSGGGAVAQTKECEKLNKICCLNYKKSTTT